MRWYDAAVRRLRTSSWSSRGRWLLRGVEFLVVALLLCGGALFVYRYASIAIDSIAYNQQLEWMEGGFLEVVQRVRAGEPIYQEPSIDYVAYLYTPLYFWLSALLSYIFGLEFLTVRLVSLGGTVAIAVLLQQIVYREVKSWAWSLVAPCVFLATWDASGRWFHLARVDMLALALLMGAVATLRFGERDRSAVVGGGLLWLAFLSKQSTLVIGAAVVTALLLFEPRRASIAASVAAALIGASVLALDQASDGWFSYFVFDVGSQHDVVEGLVKGFWTGDVWRVGVGFAVAIFGFREVGRRDNGTALFYGALVVGALMMSWMSRMHSGGYINVLIPVHIIMALGIGFIGGASASSGPDGERARLGWSPTSVAAALLVVLQLVSLDYDHTTMLPDPNGESQGAAFVSRIGSIEGEVLLPDFRFIQTRMKMPSHGMGMASRDLFRIANPEDRGRAALERSTVAALSEKRFVAIILSERRTDLMPELKRHYRYLGRLQPGACPVAGWAIRPGYIYVPRGERVEPTVKALVDREAKPRCY